MKLREAKFTGKHRVATRHIPTIEKFLGTYHKKWGLCKVHIPEIGTFAMGKRVLVFIGDVDMACISGVIQDIGKWDYIRPELERS